MSSRDTSLSSRLSWLLVAFIVPALIVFSVYTYLSESKLPDPKFNPITIRSEEFDRSFMFGGVEKDLHDLSYIKETISGGDSISSTAAVRTLLTEHMSLVFLIGLLAGSTVASELFKAFFYFRFGLAGASFFYFANNNLKIKEDPSLLLGTVYSLSSIVLFTASNNTAMMNMVILMPLLLSALDKMNRQRTVKSTLIAIVWCFVTALSGVPGVVCGVPFALAASVFLLLSDKDYTAGKLLKGIGRTLIVMLAGTLGASVAVFPIIKNLTYDLNFTDIFETGKVRFVLLDFIYKCLDGNISGVPSDSSSPVMGIYVFTAMLLILFFANSLIPSRSKIYAGIVMLVIYISVSYSPIDYILSFGKPSSVLLYSRLACLMLLIMTAASLSLRNVREVTTGSVYLSAFLLLGLIIVEASSGSEASLSIFSRFFSAGAVIFWAAVLIYMVRGFKELPSSAITAAIIAIAVNVCFCMGPSYSSRDDILHAFNGKQQEEVFSLGEEDKGLIPLFGDDGDTYLVLPMDIESQIAGQNYCDIMNTIMYASAMDNIFVPLPADSVLEKDMEDYGNGRYGVIPDAPRNEATIRVYLNDLSVPYYVVSSFSGNSYVTESYSDKERTNTFIGPFLMRMQPTDSQVYVKLSLSRPDGFTGDFRVYSLDVDRCDMVRSMLGNIEGDTIDLTGDHIMTIAGTKTVVTSIPYSSNITVTVAQHGKNTYIDTFEVCGKLAFTFESENFTDYVMHVGCESGDIKTGMGISSLVASAVIFIYLMYNNKTARRVEKETDLAEQKD